ncbi:MAG: hypothetical protein M3547_10775 [Acidobacteriota bacterium]|nr:hypothetical protein [Acidobacteriota bacterium]
MASVEGSHVIAGELEPTRVPSGPPWSCDSCGEAVPEDVAYAPMETLELLCRSCLEEKLGACEECGGRIRVSAYQHLPSGRAICEPCALARLKTGGEPPRH